MVEINSEAIRRLGGNVIVSSQASHGEPLCSPDHIVAMALSAMAGGAYGLRLEGAENIRAARQDKRVPSECPIVGLVKSDLIPEEDRLSTPYITNRFEDCEAIAAAGADIIALDGTGRTRLDKLSLDEVFGRIHNDLNKSVWADCATFEEGMAAVEAGADVISTTLFGYTRETVMPHDTGPNFSLLKKMIVHSKVPVILEGRVWHPEEIARAFEYGAHAVVVGSAITRPHLIAQRFVAAIPADKRKSRC